MAYLKDRQYDCRRESAARRSEENGARAMAAGMTQEQAEAVSRLCSARHELHCNMDAVAKGGEVETELKRRLISANIRIAESGLAPVEAIPVDMTDYIDIDSIDSLTETGEAPRDDEQRQVWYDSEYERIYGELEQLNSQIEDWLREIDKIYGTTYAPTGALRIM